MAEEIWKTIIDFENYQISNLGRVKNFKTNYILKNYSDFIGYSIVTIRKNNKNSSFKLHRLVGSHFIPNPENKPTIHHKNNIKHDNRIENLEWATMSEQNMAINKTSNAFLNKSNKISIIRTNILDENTIIETYNSISEAAKWIFDNKLTTIKEFNKNNNSIISSKICAVANGNRNIAYGFKWKYNVEENLENEIWKEIPLQFTSNKSNYFVSSLGRYKNNKQHIIDVKYSSGYKRIRIGEIKYLLHRLVALTFIPNPYNKEQVNHIDGNKLNNSIKNLEWVNNQENQIHKVNTGLYKGRQKIIQYGLDMNIIQSFNSINEASRKLNICKNIISRSCKEKNTKCGYQFRYDTN
jgi:hypothetical protein